MSRLSRVSGFPVRGRFGWDEGQVRVFLADRNPSRYSKLLHQGTSALAPPKPGKPAAQSDPPALDEVDQALLDTLRDSEEARDMARAAVRLAARAYGRAIVDGKLTKMAADTLKSSLEELRRTEEGWLKLEVQRGRLIERVVAAQVAGQIALRLVRALENVEALLGTQIEVWLADPKWQDMPTEDRQREVRTWFRSQGRNLRETEANEIDAMLVEASENRE